MTHSQGLIRDAKPNDKPAWDRLVGHPLQSWAWGEFRQKTGIDVVRRVIEESGTISGCWQMTFHPIPYTPFTVGYFPKGPFPAKQMLDDLAAVGKQKHALSIQIEPDVIHTSRTALHASRFFLPSHRPLFAPYTFVLDLTEPEQELLAAMSPKTRYNIRLAQKHGVAVREDNSPNAFRAYLRLTMETTQRQKFYAHNQRYHELMWKTLREEGIAHLLTAVYKETILAAWILFVWKDTLYYPYGASSRKYREVMAPNLLLWEAALWGKKQGLTRFDLWGALGPDPSPTDPWYGFHRFKEGYRPKLIQFIGSYDLVINPVLYPLYAMADSLRWKILRTRT